MSEGPRIKEFEHNCEIMFGGGEDPRTPQEPHRFGPTSSVELPPALHYVLLKYLCGTCTCTCI